jgi:hypothetical protein
MTGATLLLATNPAADARWSTLARACAEDPQGRAITLLTQTGAKSAWDLFREIRRMAPPGGFAIVAGESAEEHRAALLYRALASHPVAVLKTRFDDAPLADTKWNRWVHCKLTGVNLFWTHADEARRRGARPPGELFMDRPFVLSQPRLGADAPIAMLRHAIDSLTRPTRASATGAKADHSHIGLTYITYFYLNQKSTATIFELLKKYAAYDPAVIDRVQFVIVDDGSPLSYEIPPLSLNVTWLKIKPDIPWNQAGARNLGVVYAKSDKILLTDVDHEFPEATLRHMVGRRNCGRRIYKLFRYTPEQPGRLVRGHPNVFFMSRARYLELYGVDEEFAGGYGAEDFRFMKFQKAHGSISPHLPRKYFAIEREKIDRKTAYHSLQRDHSFNTPADLRKQYESQWYGAEAGHSRAFLDGFSWDVLSKQRREVAYVRPMRRWWKPLWWLRAILPRW